MATYYIDPSATYNGDGLTGTQAASASAPGAFNTFVGITPASDNNYYVKRGTTFNFWTGVTVNRFHIDALDNITCGSYYLVGTTEYTDGNSLDPLPILTSYSELTSTGDWVESETNVWVYNAGTNFSNEMHVAGLGSLASNIQLQAPYFDMKNINNDYAPGIDVFDTFGEYANTFGYADIAISSITPAATTSITFASATEHVAGNQGMVLLVGITINSGVDINGWHLATFSTNAICTIAVDTTGSSYTGGTLDRGTKLGIYSDANPITKWGSVFINNLQSKPFLLTNACNNITIERLSFKHSFAGVQANTGPNINFTVRYCEGDNCYTMIKGGNNSNSFANGRIHDNTAINSRSCGIYLDGKQNGSEFFNNTVTNSGLSNAFGCIYFGSADIDAATPCLVYNNTVSEILSGKMFQHEAYGIYPDSASSNIHIFNNYVYNVGGVPRWTPTAAAFSGGAVHCNSGLAGIKVISNLLVNSYNGISFSDATDEGVMTHEVYNNTIIDVRAGIKFAAIDTGTATAYNNIIYNDGTGTYEGGIGIGITTDSEGQVDQDNNLILGFQTAIGRAAGTPGTIPLGSNSIEADPLLNTDYYPYLDSPCIGAGAWTGKIMKDYGNRPFKRSKPTIGAWEIANKDPTNRNTR